MIKKSLTKSLNEWTTAGIITDEQRQSIISFEEKRSGNLITRWALYGFLVLGVSVIGIGLISLIAANWEEIPGSTKLFFDFMILTGTGALVLALDRKERDILYDATASFFALLVLASIGLISQVFHTGGELYQALFFWTAISFPLSMFSKKGFLPYLWAAGLLGALMAWSVSSISLWHSYDREEEIVTAMALLLPFLCLLFSSVMSRIKLLVLHGRAFALWSLVFFLGMVVFTDIYISTDDIDIMAKAMIPGGITATLAMAAVFSDKRLPMKEKLVILVMAGITALPYVSAALYHDGDVYRSGNELYGALYSITLLILLSVLFIIRNNRRLFNAATLLAGLRFLVVYFQVFHDLAATGFGLIFSGMVIIGVALLWFKQRDRLEHLLRKLTGVNPHDGTE
ncbi:MAG TPA: DUF2157 domain-containing protein [Spirochaetota bacterium]|nr:DUF2157 domain-containing protein [Spirochaetota bacterium]HPI87814.1 DUF2157 domain-containing protein [Spirochaetota bacterium]HPR47541.1 DUF2157 domain-containing protein [Spirochaetota bacterium]